MTVAQLAQKIKQANDSVSDVNINPEQARIQHATLLAAAINEFVLSKPVIIAGGKAGPDILTGTIED